jgi:hypothetical protein
MKRVFETHFSNREIPYKWPNLQADSVTSHI